MHCTETTRKKRQGRNSILIFFKKKYICRYVVAMVCREAQITCSRFFFRSLSRKDRLGEWHGWLTRVRRLQSGLIWIHAPVDKYIAEWSLALFAYPLGVVSGGSSVKYQSLRGVKILAISYRYNQMNNQLSQIRIPGCFAGENGRIRMHRLLWWYENVQHLVFYLPAYVSWLFYSNR